MFPKKQRLVKKTRIEKVVEKGNRISTANFFVKYLSTINPDNRGKWLNLAVSVGVKLSKKATERNRLRRRVAEVFRGASRMLKPEASDRVFEVLVMPKKSCELIKSAELSEEVKLLINKIIKNG